MVIRAIIKRKRVKNDNMTHNNASVVFFQLGIRNCDCLDPTVQAEYYTSFFGIDPGT